MLGADQIARYARHVLLPDVGGIGQAALLAACAEIDLADPAGAIAATFLAAGGVGALVLRGATEAHRAAIAARGPDTRLVDGAGDPVELPARPTWWPAAPRDDAALAWWRGSTAATRWMAAVIAKARAA